MTARPRGAFLARQEEERQAVGFTVLKPAALQQVDSTSQSGRFCESITQSVAGGSGVRTIKRRSAGLGTALLLVKCLIPCPWVW